MKGENKVKVYVMMYSFKEKENTAPTDIFSTLEKAIKVAEKYFHAMHVDYKVTLYHDTAIVESKEYGEYNIFPYPVH